MLSAKIKKINTYQFSHQAGMEVLFYNLRLLGNEAQPPVAGEVLAAENSFSANQNDVVLSARIFLADPSDKALRDFCCSAFKLETDSDKWPVSNVWPCGNFQVHTEITPMEARSGKAFSPLPALHLFLLRQQPEQLELVTEHLTADRPQPALNILLSPDDLRDDALVKSLLHQSGGRLRCFTSAEWADLGDLPSAFSQLLGSASLPPFLVAHSYIRPVRNLGKHLHALFSDRRNRLELQYKSTAFELEMIRNGSQAKNLRSEAGARVGKMQKEQSAFIEQQIDQSITNTTALPDTQLPLQNEHIGNKTVWQIHPDFLRDRLKETADKTGQIAQQVLDYHHRFMESIQQALPGTSAHPAPVHLHDLTGNSAALILPQSEDYRFEQPGGLLGRVLGGAMRPVMMTSMVLSMIGTILGLFSKGLKGFSLRTLGIFFQDSIIPQLLGTTLLLAILYILVRNYLSGRKELAHQHANEYRKMFLRLQGDLDRYRNELAKRLKINYKTLLERSVQTALANHEQFLEQQNELSAHHGRERLRTLERQLSTSQDDLKNIAEAERALTMHEETLLEYETILWQKIKPIVQS